MFLDKNIKLDKKVFDNLVICLMNIVKNCKLEDHLRNALYNNLLKFEKNEVLNQLELIVISLKILTQKHYTFNKEQILNCLHFLANENIRRSNSLFIDIENIILNSFNNQNLDKEVFNALFQLLYKNIDLLDCISLCLLNSLENKSKKEINILINYNLKKFEYLISNNHINNEIINILCKISKESLDIFKNSKILQSFILFTLKLEELKKKEFIDEYIESLLILLDKNRINICEYHIKLIEDNLDINGILLILAKIIELDKINFLTKININKIIKNLYLDFKNGITLLYKFIKCNVKFTDESLILLSNYLYNNHKEDVQNRIYIQIKNLLLDISFVQKKIPKIVNRKFIFQWKN